MLFTFDACCAACCNLNLMDASHQVVIETGRLLTPGNYLAVSTRVCTTEPMLIQVWSPINNLEYQLKWQQSYTPTAANTFQNYVTVITATDLYMELSEYVPVPYNKLIVPEPTSYS